MQPVIQPVPLPFDDAAILGSRVLEWPDEAACVGFADWLSERTNLHRCYIELQGPLGAGKTTFVRHLLRALGVDGRIKSPTYTVMEPYSVGSLVISHFDFYRFSDPREWADAGFREVFAAPGLKLAEWPEQVAGMLPLADLSLRIEPTPDDGPNGDRRTVHLAAHTPFGLDLLP